MKAIMIGIFTVCMGVFAYFLGLLSLAYTIPERPDSTRLWIICIILFVFSALSIGYGAKLGHEEDKKRNTILDEQLAQIIANKPTPYTANKK